MSSIGRLRERLAQNGLGQGGDHPLRHHRHAALSALLVQHRRHPGQVVQVDLRQSLSLPHLSRGEASPGAQGATEGAGKDPGPVLGGFRRR